MTTPWPLECSHIRCWILSLKEITSRRLSAHEKAIKTYKALWPEVVFPTFEEVLPILQYYTAKLLSFSRAKNLRPVIQETACAYFHRFYLKHSILDYDPRILIYTCICMAIKVEEYARNYSTMDVFNSLNHVDIQEIFALELPLSEALNFQLIVLHVREPLRALRDSCLKKLIADLKLTGDSHKEYTELLHDIEGSVESDCLTLQETAELTLVYTPAQLSTALFFYHASLHLSAMFDVKRFLKHFAVPPFSKAWSAVKLLSDTILFRLKVHEDIKMEKSEFENKVIASMRKCSVVYDLKKQMQSKKRNHSATGDDDSPKTSTDAAKSDSELSKSHEAKVAKQ